MAEIINEPLIIQIYVIIDKQIIKFEFVKILNFNLLQ